MRMAIETKRRQQRERVREKGGGRREEKRDEGKSCWTVATRRFESNDLVIVLPREAKDLR